MKKLGAQMNSLRNLVLFVVRNILMLSKMNLLPEKNIQCDMKIRPCLRREVGDVLSLRPQIDGEQFSLPVRLLIRALPGRSCFVVVEHSGHIVAFTVYYFNSRDVMENTIHEGFIGVVKSSRGLGIAGSIRKYIKEEFAGSKTLSGISSRITLDNVASVKTGESHGYQLVETYHDPVIGKERGYFVSNFICDK